MAPDPFDEAPIPAIGQLPFFQHVDVIDVDIFHEIEIMRDEDHRGFSVAHRSDRLRHDPEGIDVESGIDLVKDDVVRLEQPDLQKLNLALLSSAEADIEVSGEHLLRDGELFEQRLDEAPEDERSDVLRERVLRFE